jgi:hypothetical protein
MQNFTGVKDPDAVHDYIIDWSDVMNMHDPVDTLTTSSWTVNNGLVLDSNSYTTTESTAWVSAGDLGEICLLVNTVTTATRTYVRTIKLSIKDT